MNNFSGNDRVSWFVEECEESNLRLDWISKQGIVRPTIIKHIPSGCYVIRISRRTHKLNIVVKDLLRFDTGLSEFNSHLRNSGEISTIDIDVDGDETKAINFCYWFCSEHKDDKKFLLPRSSNFFFKEISGKLRDTLDGALAGDGCYYKRPGKGTAFKLALGIKQLGHLEEFKDELYKFGYNGKTSIIEMSSPGYGKEPNRKICSLQWNLWCFNNELSRWYGNDGKKLPSDVNNSSSFWRWFYAGDGSLSIITPRAFRITLHSNDFSKNDVDRLVGMLLNLNFKASSMKKRESESTGRPQFIIHISGSSVRSFLEYIGPPVKSLEYKWNLPDLKIGICKACGGEFPIFRSNRKHCYEKECSIKRTKVISRRSYLRKIRE